MRVCCGGGGSGGGACGGGGCGGSNVAIKQLPTHSINKTFANFQTHSNTSNVANQQTDL